MYLRLVSSLTRLDLTIEENVLSFVSREAVESNLVKLETYNEWAFPMW